MKSIELPDEEKVVAVEKLNGAYVCQTEAGLGREAG